MKKLGVTNDDAEAIRDLRNVVHGKGKLTLAGTRNVEKYNDVLWSAVNLALKRALNIPDASPPLQRISLQTRNLTLNYTKVDGGTGAADSK